MCFFDKIDDVCYVLVVRGNHRTIHASVSRQRQICIRVSISTGHAAHTDIIVASTKAYVNALNKLIMDKQGVSGRKETADRDGSV